MRYRRFKRHRKTKMNKDSKLQITALVERLRTDVNDTVDGMEYDVRKAIAETLRKGADNVENTTEDLEKALADAGVIISMSNSKLGIRS